MWQDQQTWEHCDFEVTHLSKSQYNRYNHSYLNYFLKLYYRLKEVKWMCFWKISFLQDINIVFQLVANTQYKRNFDIL